MADTAAAPAEVAASTPAPSKATAETAAAPKKSKAAAGPRKTKKTPTAKHPKASEMVTEAITELQERGGSSLRAIKKWVAENYEVDVQKQATFIKKYLRSAVISGALIQTKGTGATGSFKLNIAPPKPRLTPGARTPKAVVLQPPLPTPVKKPVIKKVVKPVKAVGRPKGVVSATSSSGKKAVGRPKISVAPAKAKTLEKKKSSPKKKSAKIATKEKKAKSLKKLKSPKPKKGKKPSKK